jgi:small GTP-binding protein
MSLCGGTSTSGAPLAPLITGIKPASIPCARVIFLGDLHGGKSSVFKRRSDNAVTTIGFGDTRTETLSGVKLQLWDTVGQERFDALPPQFYRAAIGCVLVTDTTCPSSLQRIGSWLAEFDERAPLGGFAVLVGNKADLLGGDEARARAAKALDMMAASFSTPQRVVPAFLCSAKTGENLEQLYDAVAARAVLKLQQVPVAAGGGGGGGAVAAAAVSTGG